VLHLGLQVVQDGVLHQAIFIGHVLDHVMGLFGSEVRFLIKELFLPHLSSRLLVFFDLTENVVLVLHVFIQRELTLRLHQHLLLFDVAEELVPLRLSLILDVPEIVLKPVVSRLPGLPFPLISMLSLLLHVRVNRVGTLRVHHDRVACVISIVDVLAV